MASTGVIFFDKNQQMFKTPQEATRSDLAAVLGQVGEGESLATGVAQKLLDNRAEIEEIRGVSVSRGTLDQLLELEWIKFGRRRMTPGRPVTFVVTQEFLDHFGLESARDLPGLKELRSAGLLESRPPPGESDAEVEDDEDQSEMFEDEA